MDAGSTLRGDSTQKAKTLLSRFVFSVLVAPSQQQKHLVQFPPLVRSDDERWWSRRWRFRNVFDAIYRGRLCLLPRRYSSVNQARAPTHSPYLAGEYRVVISFRPFPEL